jgi:hypothetical protein
MRRRPVALVLIRRKQRGGGAIRFGDEPHAAGGSLKGAQDPRAVPGGAVVGVAVIGVRATPVAETVADEPAALILERLRSRETIGGDGVRRRGTRRRTG